MKKNYSTPEFMLVTLGSKDIVCTSNPLGENDLPRGGITTGSDVAGAKRRNIWEDE